MNEKRKRMFSYCDTAKRELCSFESTCKCVCVHEKEKTVSQSTKGGEQHCSSLRPTSFTIALFAMGVGVWRVGCGGWKGEGRAIISSHYSTCCFYLTHRYGFWWTAISLFVFSPQIHCLSDSECKVSLSGSPFSLGLTVTSTPSLLSAWLHLHLWNNDGAQDGWERLIG